jgi:3-oxoacyl-[acyl-carrier-protein] synthase-3
VKEETPADLAYLAALDAIAKADYDRSKIDLIIIASVSNPYRTPSVSNMVQAKLGLNGSTVACFDINAACTGFIYALNIASQMLTTGAYQHALVIGAETLSKVLDFSDRNTCVLFGDGAGAVILETCESKPAYFYCSSEGDTEERIIINPYIRMEGRKVYQFATKIIEESIRRILTESGLELADIDIIIPHQANIRIIESAAKSLDIGMDKFFVNIENYGNTSAASIPIALEEYLSQNKDREGKKVLLVGFGGGLTWGSAILTL